MDNTQPAALAASPLAPEPEPRGPLPPDPVPAAPQQLEEAVEVAAADLLRERPGCAGATGGAGGYLVPVDVRACADDPAKGLGVFARERIPKGTLLWRPGAVTLLRADAAATALAAMPHGEAQVRGRPTPAWPACRLAAHNAPHPRAHVPPLPPA